MDKHVFLSLLEEVARAPSAHNTQPARWRLDAGGWIELYEDPATRLPVADPHQRDQQVSLGAAFEGMVIAASSRGYRLSSIEPLPTGDGPEGWVPVLRSDWAVQACEPDPLQAQVQHRTTWRGPFAVESASAGAELTRAMAATADCRVVIDPDQREQIRVTFERCSMEILQDMAFHRELYQWLRLTPGHPRVDLDGLGYQSMGLDPMVGRVANLLMKPGVYRLWRRLPGAMALFSEHQALCSASAMVVLTAAVDEAPFETGRRLYRRWLELTAAGFVGCPMSALTDHPDGQQLLHDLLRLEQGQRAAFCLRVGLVPVPDLPRSPRLPLMQLWAD
jgi:hypothetical protein